jgi:hypothetical protein
VLTCALHERVLSPWILVDSGAWQENVHTEPSPSPRWVQDMPPFSGATRGAHALQSVGGRLELSVKPHILPLVLDAVVMLVASPTPPHEESLPRLPLKSNVIARMRPLPLSLVMGLVIIEATSASVRARSTYTRSSSMLPLKGKLAVDHLYTPRWMGPVAVEGPEDVPPLPYVGDRV